MPIMDGRELLQRLAIDPAFAKVPIALITSGSKPPAGYVVFRKPLFDLDALLTFVRQAVARAR
jgi:CheY-like chemotaxis protein